MSRHAAWKIIKSDYLKLVLILALASYVVFIPHLHYPYAVHIDEWVSIAQSQALMHAGSINYPDPLPGQESGRAIMLLELGYHLITGVFQQISGLSWMTIARYFPSFVFVFTILSVYIFAKKEGFGWHSAFFASLLPTTVGILGPAFAVPVAMGLMFASLVLYLVFNHKTIWTYLVISTCVSFLVVLHAPSAFLVVVGMLPFVLLALKGDFRHSLGVMAAIALPFLATLPFTYKLIVLQIRALLVQVPLPTNHDLIHLLTGYGYLPILFLLLGVFSLSIRGGRRNYSLVLALVLLLAILMAFFEFHYGVAILYLRGLLFSMLMMSIIAGAGLRELWALDSPLFDGIRSRMPLTVQMAGVFLTVSVICVTLALAIPNRKAEPYYHMIDRTDYTTFAWIQNNIKAGSRAILDPWKATPFAAVTGEYVFSRIHSSAKTSDQTAYDFLRNGSSNTSFLRANGITVVYTRVYEWANGKTVEYPVDNPDLVQVHSDVYILKPDVNK